MPSHYLDQCSFVVNQTAGDSFLVNSDHTWRRHQMETSSALLVICAGNSPVTAEFPAQRPVTRSFDVFFDLRLNKRLSNISETGDLRRHRVHYDVIAMHTQIVAQGNVFENVVPYMISILCKLKDTNLFGREHKLSNRRINSISWFYSVIGSCICFCI